MRCPVLGFSCMGLRQCSLRTYEQQSALRLPAHRHSAPSPAAPARPHPLLGSALLQTWCRGKKKWDSECLCLDCHSFSYRSYCDPDFKTPEEYEKERWQARPAPCREHSDRALVVRFAARPCPCGVLLRLPCLSQAGAALPAVHEQCYGGQGMQGAPQGQGWEASEKTAPCQRAP